MGTQHFNKHLTELPTNAAGIILNRPSNLSSTCTMQIYLHADR